MIENFLTLQGRAGALAGPKPEHAFYVKVGLGQTMTAQDILEGRMIVEIGMAVVRPAEFIILRFRSEEHTSELQSLMRISYAVFCLKQKNDIHNFTYLSTSSY